MNNDDCRQPPPFMSYFPHGFVFSGVAAFFCLIGFAGGGEALVLLVIAVLAGLPWVLLVIPFHMLLLTIRADTIFMLPAKIFFSSSGSDGLSWMAALLWIVFFGILGAHINGMIFFRRKDRK